jgi:hypothetical protein
MTPDFYYGEILRWSFGLENPNKAAVLFACLIPLLWAGWRGAFRLRSAGWKVAAHLVTAIGFLAAWGCLLLTFSRGGLVGALAGMGVVSAWGWWRGRFVATEEWGSPFRGISFWLSCLLIGLVVAAALVLGMGSRSVEAIGNDPSVGNRIGLWGAALQMAYENPAGFGAARSGAEFMQWYQDVDRTEGYRTMVNSYLTFLVEMGWLPFVAVILAIAAFWAWTWPRVGEKYAVWQIAAWGSLAAFLVSGMFSTTMEEPLVWVIPCVVAGALVILRLCAESWNLRHPRIGWAAACTIMVFAGLFGMGMALSRADLLARQFARDENGNLTVASVRPKSKTGQQTLRVFPDESVLGPDWGKLMRILAIQTGREVRVLDAPNKADKAPDVVAIGSSGPEDVVSDDGRHILIAPTIRDLRLEGISTVLLPEIDEDGRTAFWQERIRDTATEPPQVITLVGVGTRIEWAWKQVIEAVGKQ